MAVDTLFIPSVSKLKQQLRLDGAMKADSLAVLDAAITDARTGIYDALGASRVATLKALPNVDNPTTANGLLRLKANTVELKWVRMVLMRTMPTLFMDAAASAQQAWNEEGFLRQNTGNPMEKEIARLWSEINTALEALAGGSTEHSLLEIESIGPDETPAAPGASIGPKVFV